MARVQHRRSIACVTLLCAACSPALDASSVCERSEFRSSPPMVIAHAGGEGLGPANTLLALERSRAAGADILDLDLRMTSDGVVVAVHDRSLGPMTGVDANVDETTWAKLQRLDARAVWRGAPIDRPVRIPSLEQVLTSFPDETISLELKQGSPSMSDELCDVLTRTGSIGRVYLSANDDDVLYEARDRCPGVLITTTYRDVDAMRKARDSGAAWCASAPIGQPPYRAGRFDTESVAWSHDHGLAIFTWTVDDPATLRQLAEVGVDGVYTRRPDVARAVFDEFAAEQPGTAA